MKSSPFGDWITANAPALGIRLVVGAALWVVLTEGELKGWAVGLLAIIAAAGASLRLLPPGSVRISPRGLIRFLPFFLAASFSGGIDVARRAMRRSPDLAPGFIEFPLRLRDPGPRTFFITLIGLLPGTLSARLDADSVSVHLLEVAPDRAEQLRRLESRVADLLAARILRP